MLHVESRRRKSRDEQEDFIIIIVKSYEERVFGIDAYMFSREKSETFPLENDRTSGCTGAT